MREQIEAVIGMVKKTDTGWDISLAPDNETWLSVAHGELKMEPKPGDYLRILTPKIIGHHRPPEAKP